MTLYGSACGVAEVEIPPSDRSALHAALNDLAAQYGSADHPVLLSQAFTLGHLLPPAVLEHLRRVRYLESAAALVIRGAPVTCDPGPTPMHWRERSAGASVLYDVWLLLLSAQLGDPVCWSSLQDGRLFNDVLPILGEESEQTGHGSEEELKLHVEDAFHDDRCDALALLCLRNDDGVPTTIADVSSLDVAALDTDTLFEARFLIHPDSEHLRNTQTTTDPNPRLHPILFGARESPYLRVDPACTLPVAGDTAARKAMDALHEQLQSNLVDVTLRLGDVLLVDNFRAVHGRRPFRARYDGTDRWMRKLTVVRDLRRSRPARDGVSDRVISPFAPQPRMSFRQKNS